MRIELRVLYERLPGLRLVTKYEDRVYDDVHEGRGIDKLIVAWDVESAIKVVPSLKSSSRNTPRGRNQSMKEISVAVSSIVPVAEDILQLTFTPDEGHALPQWAPGAHVDVPVGNFGWRQYSLCSNPQDSSEWKIAVLREPRGTGGSRYIHKSLELGSKLKIRGPRNNFMLEESPRYLFIAGGIGITPIKAMIAKTRASGHKYQLVYLGSSRKRMVYVKEISADSRATIWARDEHPERFSITALMEIPTWDPANLMVYCCGPTNLLADVRKIFSDKLASPNALCIEEFDNMHVSQVPNHTFDVVLSQSGRTFTIPENKSILKIVNQNGAGVLSTCEKGTCGTCEVGVIQGTPGHRDTVLTNAEKLDNKSMMVCVSRCKGDRIVLDLW